MAHCAVIFAKKDWRLLSGYFLPGSINSTPLRNINQQKYPPRSGKGKSLTLCTTNTVLLLQSTTQSNSVVFMGSNQVNIRPTHPAGIQCLLIQKKRSVQLRWLPVLCDPNVKGTIYTTDTDHENGTKCLHISADSVLLVPRLVLPASSQHGPPWQSIASARQVGHYSVHFQPSSQLEF